ncbi:hypothetical protein [Streptomyces sp. 8N706]|uniref:hypothetical protein n=1 Tax=Streptomyces sp. 8N706 TaxID=3457416 RepID=UPI003FD17D4F
MHGLSLPQYLVHLGHTLAESVLTGVPPRSGDRITTVHVRRVTAPARRPLLSAGAPGPRRPAVAAGVRLSRRGGRAWLSFGCCWAPTTPGSPRCWWS